MILDAITTGVGGGALTKATRLFEILTVDCITTNASDPAENGLFYIDIS